MVTFLNSKNSKSYGYPKLISKMSKIIEKVIIKKYTLIYPPLVRGDLETRGDISTPTSKILKI